MARPKKTKTTTIFATNLKKVLEERSLTMKMAADLMSTPVTTLADWLNGAAPSDIEAIGRLCRKLNLDFGWLMLNEPAKAPDLSQLPVESLFEEKDVGMSGFYKITATRLVPRKRDEK